MNCSYFLERVFATEGGIQALGQNLQGNTGEFYPQHELSSHEDKL